MTDSIVSNHNRLDPPCPCGSGKLFSACHGAGQLPSPIVTTSSAAVTRKLDLACGQVPAPSFEGVDIWPNAQHVVDLQRYPWPFADNSVAELRCSHYIEHIPMEYVETPSGRKDALFAFFDECYRILIPGGNIEVVWPALRHSRAFQDPTHRRFIPIEMVLYLWKEWRVGNKLDHYAVVCDFRNPMYADRSIDVQSLIADPAINGFHDDVKARYFNNYWNVITDHVARGKAYK